MKANEAPETYPIQFKDKIDKYLWEEHHILGGCCSSIESLKYAVAREVAEKITDAFIEKAVQYLKDHKDEVETEDNGIAGWISDKFIKEFVKYMKGE